MRTISELELNLVYGGDGGGSIDQTDAGVNHTSPWGGSYSGGGATYSLSPSDVYAINDFVASLLPNDWGSFWQGAMVLGGLALTLIALPATATVGAMAGVTYVAAAFVAAGGAYQIIVAYD